MPSDEFDPNVLRLEEYKSLRAELLERIRNQQLIVVANVTLVGAGVAAVEAFGDFALRDQFLAYMAVAFLSLVLLFRYLDQESLIAVISGYLNRCLRRQFENQCSDAVTPNYLSWEDYRFRHLTPVRSVPVVFLGIFSGAAAALPAIVILIVASVRLLTTGFWQVLGRGEQIAFIANAALAVTAVLLLGYVAWLYTQVQPGANNATAATSPRAKSVSDKKITSPKTPADTTNKAG